MSAASRRPLLRPDFESRRRIEPVGHLLAVLDAALAGLLQHSIYSEELPVPPPEPVLAELVSAAGAIANSLAALVAAAGAGVADVDLRGGLEGLHEALADVRDAAVALLDPPCEGGAAGGGAGGAWHPPSGAGADRAGAVSALAGLVPDPSLGGLDEDYARACAIEQDPARHAAERDVAWAYGRGLARAVLILTGKELPPPAAG